MKITITTKPPNLFLRFGLKNGVRSKKNIAMIDNKKENRNGRRNFAAT